MLPHLQQSYTHLDQTLSRLSDSISAYNPSPHLATELLSADTQISTALQTLLTHQKNHLRIQSLYKQISNNDTRLKELFQQIVTLRKEMAGMRGYEAEEGKGVEVEELLKYAKFISKTTVPPTFRGREKGKEGSSDVKGVAVNGVVSPDAGEGETRAASIRAKTMNAQEKEFLDPLAGAAFEPWPSAMLIQRGALGDIQRLVDKGVDPAEVLSPEEQAEVDRRRKEEEEREKVEQEERERRRMSMFDVGRRRNTLAQDDVFDPDA